MKKMTQAKISVITASFNAAEALDHTIQNVAQQSYPSVEHIIIDGDSTDDTKNLLLSYETKIKWLSEPDKGISDAFNKGVQLASGDYLFFLGAGDTFVNPEVLSNIFNHLETSPVLICGKVMRVSEQGKPLWQAPKRWPSRFDKKSLLKKLTLPHQGLFMHQEFFKKFGLFDLSCKFAMDYEILLRAYHQFPSILLVDELVAHWQAGGVGKGRILEIYDEYRRIKKQHRVAPDYILWGIDHWNRLKYQIKTLAKA